MIPSNLHFIKNSVLGTLISGLTLWGGNASAAVVTASYPETAPTSNIVSSYAGPANGEYGVYNGLGGTSNYRDISTSFAAPASSDYLITSLTMQIYSPTGTNFTSPVNFSIDVWSLPTVNSWPTSVGASLQASFTGTMQPSSSQTQAGDYITFNFATPVLVSAGQSYSFVMGLDDASSGNILRWGVGPLVSTSRAAASSNGGAWANASATYIYYVQGTAVPEPSAMVLLGLAGVVVLLVRKRTMSARRAA